MKKRFVYSLMPLLVLSAGLFAEEAPMLNPGVSIEPMSKEMQLVADQLMSAAEVEQKDGEGAKDVPPQIIISPELLSTADTILVSDTVTCVEALHKLGQVTPLGVLKRVECSIQPISPDSERYKHRQATRQRHTDKGSLLHGTSTNWSGYAAAKTLANPVPGSVTQVGGIWKVPVIYPSAIPTYSSIWVGIDGYSNSTVEQLGTEHDWYNGAQQNSAWFEMYPRQSFDFVGFPVHVNDLIGAVVQYLGNGVFQLAIINYTRGAFAIAPYSNTTSTVAQRSSAEWIVEAPSSNTGVLPLAAFSPVPLACCTTTMNGVFGAIANPNWQNDPIFMVAPGGGYKAAPSGLIYGSGFFVFWGHH